MNYEQGLEALKKLAEGGGWLNDFAPHEAALRENLRDERRYGPDEQSRRARIRIADQLNELALTHAGISFNDLCLGKTPPLQAKTALAIDKGSMAILFLAADPTDTARLRLGEELREIQEKLQLSKERERFELHQRLSVRPADVSQALLDILPQIVHFSGHGAATGEICLEDNTGIAHPVPPAALAALFEQFDAQIRCVVLNACYSETQARAIVQHIPYVVGMHRAIGDQAAIAFSVGFYQALGAGRSFEDAYKLGCVQISMRGIAEHLTPVLLRKRSNR